MYNIQDTLLIYTVHSALYFEQCILHRVQCSVHSKQCALHSVQCTVCTVHCRVRTVIPVSRSWRPFCERAAECQKGLGEGGSGLYSVRAVNNVLYTLHKVLQNNVHFSIVFF